jgi:hypothetical protein
MATNNAIDAPLPLTVTNGGSGRATGTTAYGTLCAGTTATGVQQTVAPGTAGNVLTSNGTSALPSYQAPAGSSGALTWLASVTASSSTTVSFANLLSATYDNYLITVENLAPSVTSIGYNMIVGTGATPSYQTTNYSSGTLNIPGSGGAPTSSTVSSVQFQIVHLNSGSMPTTFQSAGNINLYSVNSGNNFMLQSTIVAALSGTTPFYCTGMICSGQWIGTGVTSVQFSSVSGNITTGTFKLYGYQN